MDPMPSKAIADLTHPVQLKYLDFEAKMMEARIPFMVTSTLRTIREQAALYAQGRTKPGKIVTWTMNSKHLPRVEDDGTPDEGRSHAFDIAIVRDGKPVWDTKVDVNEDEIPDYLQAGEIAESVGLKWGGRWKSPDMPHMEG